MLPGSIAQLALIYTNTAPAQTNIGTSITPGASNAEGAWTQIASAANIADEIALIVVQLAGGSTSGQIKQHFLDIGIDAAGGTSYTAILQNLACGGSSPAYYGHGGHWFAFPLRIPAGASVAVRIQGSNATAGTVRVAAWFHGRLSAATAMRIGQYTETLGVTANTVGTTVTAGNAAESAWVSIGTTTLPLWWFQLGIQINTTTITATSYEFDIAYGDGTNMTMIAEHVTYSGQSASDQNHPLHIMCAREVPTGSTIYVRGRGSVAGNANLNVTVVGVGG